MKSRIGGAAFILALGILSGFGCNQAPSSPPVAVINTTPAATHTITHNYHTTRVIEKVKSAPTTSTTTTHVTTPPPSGDGSVETGTSTTTVTPDSSSTTTTDPGASSTTTTTVH